MTKPAAWWPAPLALLGLVLAGCGGSSSQSAAPPGSPSGSSTGSTPSSASMPSSSAPAPGFASTSAGTPRGVISMPDFLIEMNRMCSSFDAKLKALPTPVGATDFAKINANLTGNLRLAPAFLSQAEALVSRTAVRAALEKNWLATERADFAAFRPLAQRMIADSKAHNAAKVQADASALSALPDHGKTVAAYLNGVGLSSCARLESE
jgi:hypothetical protein